MPKDYYKILGVSKSSTQDEIKKAFRKLAHQYHPDKTNGGDAQKFKEINEAYQVLGNKERRQQYDQFGTTAGPGGFGGGGQNPFGQGFDFSRGFGGGFSQAQNVDFDIGDIFDSFFGGGGPTRSSRTKRGSDIEVDLEISLKEAVFGVSQNISIKRQNKCDVCQGTGAEKGTAFKQCERCEGQGHVSTTVFGAFRTQTVCPECSGQGKIIEKKCGQCSGDGTVTENVDVKVEVPAGIDDGQAIRLSGQGNAGAKGAPAGDLYVNIQIRGKQGFVRQGDDLVTEHYIPYTMAALGGHIQVETVEGKVKLKIPSGTPSGKKFVLKDKGVTHLKSRGRGDQIVVVRVEVPTKLSRKQKKLLEELDKELNQ